MSKSYLFRAAPKIISAFDQVNYSYYYSTIMIIFFNLDEFKFCLTIYQIWIFATLTQMTLTQETLTQATLTQETQETRTQMTRTQMTRTLMRRLLKMNRMIFKLKMMNNTVFSAPCALCVKNYQP